MKRSPFVLSSLAVLSFVATASAADPPNFNAMATGSPSRDANSFVWSTKLTKPRGNVATFEDAARDHLLANAAKLGVSSAAIATANATHTHDLGHGGVVVTFRQAPNGVELFHHDVKVLMTRDMRLVAFSGGLHPNAVAKPKTNAWTIDDGAAIVRAFADLEHQTLDRSAIVATKLEGGYRFFDVGARGTSRVKRVYFTIDDRLVASWFLELFVGQQSYAFVVAGDDGRVLYRENLTHNDVFNYRVYADADGDKRPWDGPLADYTPYPAPAPNGSYPDFRAPSLVSIDGFNATKDPWLATGATQTKGNNVDAYTDDDAPDGFSGPPDIRAATTSPNTFDRTYDVTLGPQDNDEQRQAAVTDLFYVTNWLHDYWYDSGFDEKAGNAQASNFGRGGLQNDPLHAEGQDGAPDQRDNSNMSVPADGVSPRMQMFIWTGKSNGSLTIPQVAPITQFGFADFGPAAFDVSGSVVLADDGTGTTTDACETITNAVSGSIVLVDRGTCPFQTKAENVAAAGGIGMIVVDNQTGEAPPDMPPVDGTTVTIPSMSITESDGQAVKTALTSGAVTAEMTKSATVDRDGTIDNSVIAHEYGHYIHLRQVACGNPACAAESEGWGDFDAMQLIVRQGDDLDGAFAMAQYATYAFPDDPAYFGIRRFPYSTDMTKNPLTFKHITSGEPLPTTAPIAASTAQVDNAEAHSAGEIWAEMLFEGMIALMKNGESGTASYDFEGARRRMTEYVEGGLQLAPTDPTYTEQRDAILATAFANDPADLLILAQAFAKRGAGTCAVSPPRDSQDFTGVVESFIVSPNASVLGVTVDDSLTSCDNDGRLDAGERGNITVTIANNGNAALTGATVSVVSKTAGASFPNGATATIDSIDPFTQANAVIAIALDPKKVTKKENLDLEVTIDAPGACASTSMLTTAPFVDYDEVAMGSASDDVEASKNLWKPNGDGAAEIWGIVETAPGNHAWKGIDFASPSDTNLESPALDVSATDDFVIDWDEAYQFEQSMGVNWDGGVLEISTDGGKTWADVSMYGDPGYGGTIGDPSTNGAQNALRNRQGYVGQNASFPAVDHATVNLGKMLAGKTVRVRFRIGSDDAVGAIGWTLDNLAFTGVTNKPFTALVDNQKSCGDDVITADAGPDQKVDAAASVTLDGSKSTDTSGLPLGFTWTQSAGPSVDLGDATKASVGFTAPAVTEETKLTFTLAATDGQATGKDTVDVLVEPAAASGTTSGGVAQPIAIGGCGCRTSESPGSTGALASLLFATAMMLRRRRAR